MNKRKKNSRQRGGTTHGWGSMKKHRGKGNKGGSGMAGTGKRGDAKKPSIWGEKYFGKYGFKSDKKKNSINLLEVAKLDMKKEGESYFINLHVLGYQKLLGKGNINKPVKIIVNQASRIAMKKVQDNGGEVVNKEG